MKNLIKNLQSYSDALTGQYNIPGVSLAVWYDNELYTAATGVLNIDTGVEATPDSIFQIGSITKVFTACLVMQLVDEGRVELDSPVKQYLRDFQVADAVATHTITVRQLLNHTSGITGDFFPNDQKASGNPIARYVDRCNLLPQIHMPGEQISYSNAGYAIAGRLVEVLYGISWFEAVEEKIYRPLGMSHAVADPKNALRYRAAMGHIPHPEDSTQWMLSPICYASMGLSPGGRLAMSASDLIIFARTHLDNGNTPSEKSWLSPASIQLMQTPDTPLPPISQVFDVHRGLGWGISIDRYSGRSMISHSGETAGQQAVLRMFPDRDSAFVVLLNSVKAGVADAIVNDLMASVADMHQQEPEPDPTTFNANELTSYTGSFESFAAVYKVTLKNNSNILAVSCTDKLHNTTSHLSWLPLEGQMFAAYNEQGVRLPNVVFLNGKGSARPNQLFVGGRLIQRSSCSEKF